MHELSIACEILDIVETAIGPGKRLLRVGVAVGPLAGVCTHSLEFCFSELAAARGLGTPELDILPRPLCAVCTACGTQYETRDPQEGCPACGSIARRVVAGFECQVERVTFEEMDTDDATGNDRSDRVAGDGEEQSCGRGEPAAP